MEEKPGHKKEIYLHPCRFVFASASENHQNLKSRTPFQAILSGVRYCHPNRGCRVRTVGHSISMSAWPDLDDRSCPPMPDDKWPPFRRMSPLSIKDAHLRKSTYAVVVFSFPARSSPSTLTSLTRSGTLISPAGRQHSPLPANNRAHIAKKNFGGQKPTTRTLGSSKITLYMYETRPFRMRASTGTLRKKGVNCLCSI